jgi:GNAT superfamily N-acetyltransferase
MQATTAFTAREARGTDDLLRFCSLSGCSPLTPPTLAEHHADAHWLLTDAAGAPVARCSLWWTATPPYQDQSVGVLGHYAASSAAAGERLLRVACDQLAAHGCTLAIGPMDGSTHRAYRLVTEPGTQPPFFLEPATPAAYPTQFAAAGFHPLAAYYSALQPTLEPADPRLPAIAARLAARGVHIRPLDVADLDGELRRIHAVVNASFAASRRLVPHIVPDLVLLAERAGQPIGLLFVVPDLNQALRGQPIDTLILKTLAVRPEYAGGGLAGWLIARGLETARDLGYTRVIHALMHADNRSRRLSQRFSGAIIRRYALYGRSL